MGFAPGTEVVVVFTHLSMRPGPPLRRYSGEVLADLRVILEKMQSSWKEGLSELQGWTQSLSVYVCLGNGF